MRRRHAIPRNEREAQARNRSLHALAQMRKGASTSRAARENGVTLRTMKRYLGSALSQDRPGGRLRATKSDRLVRYLQIPGPHGPIEITAHGSKQASEIARYKAAVNRFLAGDSKALAPWRGRKIAGVELITDGPTLKGLTQNDLLPYSLYRILYTALSLVVRHECIAPRAPGRTAMLRRLRIDQECRK
jgi:hypothetical protein